jgi:hypothetical protein
LLVKVWVDGMESQVTTGAADAVAVTSGALKTAIDLVLAAAGGSYLVADTGGGLQITRTDNTAAPLSVEVLSQDPTQTISAAEWRDGTKVLSAVTDRDSGNPETLDNAGSFSLLAGDGYSPKTGAAVSCLFRLYNGSAGAKSARWQLHVWSPVWGWYIDPEVGTRTATEATGAAFVDDPITVQVDCGSRVAMVLVDDGAAGDLAGANVHVDGWMAIA